MINKYKKQVILALFCLSVCLFTNNAVAMDENYMNDETNDYMKNRLGNGALYTEHLGQFQNEDNRLEQEILEVGLELESKIKRTAGLENNLEQEKWDSIIEEPDRKSKVQRYLTQQIEDGYNKENELFTKAYDLIDEQEDLPKQFNKYARGPQPFVHGTWQLQPGRGGWKQQ